MFRPYEPGDDHGEQHGRHRDRRPDDTGTQRSDRDDGTRRADPNATKRAVLAVDADGDAAITGRPLLYRIVVRNDGNAAATLVLEDDLLDPNTALVIGSVQTSQGAIQEGNTAGDNEVRVALAPCRDHRPRRSLPCPDHAEPSGGCERVSNQAIISANNARPSGPTIPRPWMWTTRRARLLSPAPCCGDQERDAGDGRPTATTLPHRATSCSTRLWCATTATKPPLRSRSADAIDRPTPPGGSARSRPRKARSRRVTQWRHGCERQHSARWRGAARRPSSSGR